MVEPIASEERFGDATVAQTTGPKHTTDGHERCVYYPGFKPICTHDEMGEGGFYSEDYVREIKQAAHRVLGIFDKYIPDFSKVDTIRADVEKLRELTI